MNANQKNILIAGGTGLIGQRLSELMLAKGWKVAFLSRSSKNSKNNSYFQWTPSEGKMDINALTNTTHIVSLAGENIAGQRWTNKYKNKIIQSRIDSANTLRNVLLNSENNVQSIICASAIGFYGDRKNEQLSEIAEHGIGFLADTTNQWEKAYNDFPIPVTTLRIGIVLSNNGGALPQMEKTLNFGVTSVLGDGKQFMSWIHIDDLCNIFIKAIEDDSYKGTFNAVAPNPVTNREFMATLQKVKNKHNLILSVPKIMLKIIMGEQSAIVLESVNASSKKLEKKGFMFLFKDLTSALKNLYDDKK